MLIQYNLKWALLRCVTAVLVNVCGGQGNTWLNKLTKL